jgi:large subunit ribosomal protein L25
MESVKITASARPESGKGAARRLRSAGQIPAVAYGRNLKSTPIAVSPKAVVDMLHGVRGRNTVLDIDIEGKRLMALLCDYQYHPVTRQLLHADFLEIREDEPVDVDVPFEATGKSQGIVLGGTLRVVYRTLPLRCLPKDIPVKIEYDITDVGLEESVGAGALTLPPGVSVRLPPEQTVLAIITEKRRGEAEEQAEGAGAAEGKAAGGKAPAAGKAAAGKAPAKS